MTEHRGLYLKPPEKLPSVGVTKVTFKVFINQLRAYLEQDASNYLFLPGPEGLYQEWGTKVSGLRINDVDAKDPDKVKLDRQLRDQVIDRRDMEAELKKLKLSRNSQLGKFITLISVLCYYTEQDDIDQNSTSFAWIIKYLERHYNIEARGAHFLDIASLTFKKGTPHQTFFKQFRAGFLDNLRKKGEKLAYKGDEKLNDDEKMTPTLEATIILWALERIDARLPVKVQRTYGHQMVNNTCLVTLQATIFQNIPLMLQELDESHSKLNANSLTDDQLQPSQLNAGFAGQQGTGWRGGRGGRRSRGGRGQFSNSRGRGMGRRGQAGSRGNVGGERFSDKFCRICYHAGSPRSSYQNHSISECTLLSAADIEDLTTAMATAEVTEDEEWDQCRSEAFEAPGWDVDVNKDEIKESKSYQCSYSCDDIVQLSTITPIPSQTLATHIGDLTLTVTLDSGATVSFIRLDIATRLGLKFCLMASWPSLQTK